MASRSRQGGIQGVKPRQTLLGFRFNPTSTVSSLLNNGRANGITSIRRVSAGFFEIKLDKHYRDIDAGAPSLWVGNDLANAQLHAVVSGVRSSTGDSGYDTLGIFTYSGTLTSSLVDFEDTDVQVSAVILANEDFTS